MGLANNSALHPAVQGEGGPTVRLGFIVATFGMGHQRCDYMYLKLKDNIEDKRKEKRGGWVQEMKSSVTMIALLSKFSSDINAERSF